MVVPWFTPFRSIEYTLLSAVSLIYIPLIIFPEGSTSKNIPVCEVGGLVLPYLGHTFFFTVSSEVIDEVKLILSAFPLNLDDPPSIIWDNLASVSGVVPL
jgi:hypothetical protein